MIQQNLKDDSTKKLKYSWNEFYKKRKEIKIRHFYKYY